MNGSWSSPSDFGQSRIPDSNKNEVKPVQGCTDDEKYYALVVDSGAIIKHSGFSTLHNSAQRYFTTQGVIDEIRDSKARSHLESLPFELQVRDPSPDGIAQVVAFSKKTGDYSSLSAVDMHVLALLYDLEKEGCITVEHIRKEPKRALTGKIVPMVKSDELKNTQTNIVGDEDKPFHGNTPDKPYTMENSEVFFKGSIEEQDGDQEELNEDEGQVEVDSFQPPQRTSSSHISWAQILNPSITQDTTFPIKSETKDLQKTTVEAKFGSMNLDKKGSGQFSDASLNLTSEACDSSEDGDEFASIGDDFSDEECDVYILDPEEVDKRKRQNLSYNVDGKDANENQLTAVDPISSELDMEFPSLSAASGVPCEEFIDDENRDNVHNAEKLRKNAEEDRKKRESSLKPISKSGKLYNSFRAYKDVMTPGRSKVQAEKKQTSTSSSMSQNNKAEDISEKANASTSHNYLKSRVIGGVGLSGQSAEVEDDGEGWVTSTQEIAAMKVTGTLDPFGRNKIASNDNLQNKNLPPKSKRTACATTDFAMQNVILQMNLELLSVDGVKVRKLKSWVTRCAVCFKIYTGSENDGRRLFCEKCGSSALQRIAASVDGNTGRLKLHLKKNYRSATRGTQFALPKPGSQNRFMGDLLLAEDQLLYGAWNQRVKITKSKKEKESIFGADIAANVGCHKDLTKRDDIKVGFGRKNPNATKFGRERRGKKKKSTDKACGVRRY
jgi:Predicted nucleic acid-binding protein, consists of a PIN domain and a Zn-ribbon module